MGKGLKVCCRWTEGWAGGRCEVWGAAPPLIPTPSRISFCCMSEIIKIYTTGWFLTGKEEGRHYGGVEGGTGSRAVPWAQEGGQWVGTS